MKITNIASLTSASAAYAADHNLSEKDLSRLDALQKHLEQCSEANGNVNSAATRQRREKAEAQVWRAEDSNGVRLALLPAAIARLVSAAVKASEHAALCPTAMAADQVQALEHALERRASGLGAGHVNSSCATTTDGATKP